MITKEDCTFEIERLVIEIEEHNQAVEHKKFVLKSYRKLRKDVPGTLDHMTQERYSKEAKSKTGGN